MLGKLKVSQKDLIVKSVSLLLIVLLVVNLVLMVMGVISSLYFWIIVVICALIAYRGLEIIKRNI